MRVLALIVAFLAGHALHAQDEYRVGFMPEINLNHKLGDRLKFNSGLEVRPLVSRGSLEEDFNQSFDFERADFTNLLAYKLRPGKTLSGGYMLRYTPDSYAHRTIQQYAIVRNLRALKLAHRLAADQTFRPDEAPEYRFRYRIAMEFGLNGLIIDPNEFYFTVNNEVLLSVQSDVTAFELRVVPSLGYQLPEGRKLEAGFDYRVEPLGEADKEHQLWLTLTYFFSLADK